MSFNFGGFAGGLSDGFNSGVRMGKTLRDIIKENKMQETLQAARQEAAATYDAQNQQKASSVETGPATPGQAYKDPETGSTVTPVAGPGPVASTGLPPLGEGGQASAPPNVAGQMPAAPAAPAAPATGASSEGNAGEAEAQAAMVKPSPQQVAAAGVPGATPAPVEKGKFYAGNVQTDTRAGAEAAAGVKNDPMARSAFIQKHMAQKAQDYFLSIGDMESAEKYGKYAETLAGKQAIKDWADAKTAPDIDTRAKNFGKYYTDHVNDGVNYAGHKILTKEDGTQVAVVTLKDKATGKTSEMELSDQKMAELGDAWNPAAVFKNEKDRLAAAATQKAKMGEKVLESKLKMGEEGYKQDRLDQREDAKLTKTGQQKLSEISLKGQIDAAQVGEKAKVELSAKTDALKAYGFTEEEIKPMVPMLLKVGEYKKMTDPAERRAIIGTELMKSDPTFSRASAEDQRARIDKVISAITSTGGEPAKPGASPTGGKPAEAVKPAATGPVIVRDKRTGEQFTYQDGKLVPYKGAGAGRGGANPAAGGMPKTREWTGKVE